MASEQSLSTATMDSDADAHADVHAEVIGAYQRVALLAASESASLDEVLRLIGSILCDRLELNRCFVYLRREDGRFQGRIGYRVGGAHLDRRLRSITVGGEEDGLTREMVASLKPVVMADPPHDNRVPRRVTRRWGISDMLGVPLVVEQEVIGVIFIDNDGRPRVYRDRDIRFAQVFAGLCALAVRQCWMYHQLGEQARRIDGQRQGLAEVAKVHDAVTRAVLDGADVESVIRVVVDLLGKPVVLYSPTMEVVASGAPADSGWTTAPALTPAQANLPWARDELAKLAAGAGSVMLRATRESLCRRLMVRLQTDGTCLGYLELCELGRPFSGVDARALEQAAVSVALKVMSVRRDVENHRQEREDFCVDLLYGRRDKQWLTDHAAAFGIDAGSRHFVLRAQHAEAGPHSATDRRRRDELAGLVSRQLDGLGHTVAQVTVPCADVLLVELSTVDGVDVEAGLEERLRALFPTLVERLGIRYVIVSDPVADLGLMPARMDKLKEVAALLVDSSEAPRLASPRELDLMLLMARNRQGHGVARYARELLAPLLNHDAATGSSLVETLRVYIDSRAQIRSTAAALDIHENTVRYRLNRIRELSSVDPERFESLLSVSMAFQAHDFSRERIVTNRPRPLRIKAQAPAPVVLAPTH